MQRVYAVLLFFAMLYAENTLAYYFGLLRATGIAVAICVGLFAANKLVNKPDKNGEEKPDSQYSVLRMLRNVSAWTAGILLGKLVYSLIQYAILMHELEDF